MTLEIEDRDDFKDKFAALLAANVSMITAGAPLHAELAGDLIDAFLDQFETVPDPDPEPLTALKDMLPPFTCDRGGIKYPKPTTTFRAGYVVVNAMTGYMPRDFADKLFDSEQEARSALQRWFDSHRQGKITAYEIQEATYTHG